jgi:hypothetical protein
MPFANATPAGPARTAIMDMESLPPVG